VLSVALTPDNQWVLSGSKDRGVQFWDPRTGDTQLMLQGHKNSGMSPTLRGDSWKHVDWIFACTCVQKLTAALAFSYLRGTKPSG